MKIDAHHHFWKYNSAEYPWIDDSMRAIRRDFLPSDLEKELWNAGIDGVISVQARQSLEETRWLLRMASENAFIRGVVGWVPLINPSVSEVLESLADEARLCAVRHVVQSEPDGFLLRKDFNNGVSTLRAAGLAYDLLVHEHQLPEAIRFVDQHPGQIFVLDHLAKPRIRDQLPGPWCENLKELALRGNVFCKVSGIVTEANFVTWSELQLRPYFDVALEAFGTARLMFGTDWPVCLVACPYRRWYDVVRGFTESLSSEEKADIFGRTAERAYGLSKRR